MRRSAPRPQLLHLRSPRPLLRRVQVDAPHLRRIAPHTRHPVQAEIVHEGPGEDAHEGWVGDHAEFGVLGGVRCYLSELVDLFRLLSWGLLLT